MNVERLEQVAQQLVGRLRTDPPDDNAEWLRGQLPDPAEWLALAFVLAAGVPVDESWRTLTAWTRIEPVEETSSVDEIAIERACRGIQVPLTIAEKREAVRRLSARKVSAKEIGRRLQISTRQVQRYREQMRPENVHCETSRETSESGTVAA